MKSQERFFAGKALYIPDAHGGDDDEKDEEG